VGDLLSAVEKDEISPEVKRMRKVLRQVQNAYVTVGIHEDAGQYEDETPIVKVALWNEFGTKHSPERSFFRTAIDENEHKINEWRDELLGDVIEGKITVERALDALGFRVSQLITNKIKSNVPPQNADSTAAAKVRAGVTSGTLRNTDLMLRSVGHKVFA
jgi:hypothetical protein